MRESEVAFFHNQKKGGFDPETGVIHDPETKKFERYHEMLEKEEIDKELGRNSEIEKHVTDLVSKIEAVELSGLYSGDKEQIELLEQKKAQAKRLIENVLDKIADYLITISSMHNVRVKKDEMEGAEYRKESEISENRRTSAHNALIADINIANRFISNNFGQLDEESVEEWEEAEEEAGRKILYAKRIELPQNIICVDRVNMKDRKSITDWAIQISESLAKLKKRLRA